MMEFVLKLMQTDRWTPAHYLTEENQHIGFVDPPGPNTDELDQVHLCPLFTLVNLNFTSILPLFNSHSPSCYLDFTLLLIS